MNLCGGGGGIPEHEFNLQFPDKEFNNTPRKSPRSSYPALNRKRSKSPSVLAQSNRHLSRSSIASNSLSSNQQSFTKKSIISSSIFNPVSRHDYEKLKSRQHQNHHPQQFKIKSSSIFTKKLESGFNLTWLIEGKWRPVNISTNSDKSYLRVRNRCKDEEEIENDSSKINRRDAKIKIRHISKVKSESFSALNKSERDKRMTCYFVIKMKQAVVESQDDNKLRFLAQSPAERDAIVLAIKSLVNPGNNSECSSSHIRKSQHLIDHKLPSSDQQRNNSCRNLSEIGTELKETDKRIRFSSNSLSHSTEGKNYENNFIGVEDNQRKIPSAKCSGRNTHDSFLSSTNVTKNQLLNGSRRRSKPRFEGTEAQHLSSIRTSSNNLFNKKQKSRSLKFEARKNIRPTSERRKMNIHRVTGGSVMSESFSCYPIECQSQALAAVEDGDIASFAANCTNSDVTSWCTDDICADSLKNFTDSMKGIFDLEEGFRDMNMKYRDSGNQRPLEEECIPELESKNRDIDEELHVIKDVQNAASRKHVPEKELEHRWHLHNRARNADGKAIRLRILKKRMTFEGADTKNMVCLQTISSFDDAFRKDSSKKKRGVIKSAKSHLNINNLIGDNGDSEFLFYDSDPDDARESTTKCGPRVTMSRRKVFLSDHAHLRQKEALDILDSSYKPGRKWRKLGQEVLFDIIEATKNQKFTLLWHPKQNDQTINEPPVCVKVWIEPGVYLTDGTFLLPKLTWLPFHERNLDIRVLNLNDDAPVSLDLLDVCRVREIESVNRREYPFAHVDRTFEIHTQKGRFLFETQSKLERGRVVNGLKLVIARLASLLMLRDLRAVDEFFGGNVVPGNAPDWTKRNEQSKSNIDFPVV